MERRIIFDDQTISHSDIDFGVDLIVGEPQAERVITGQVMRAADLFKVPFLAGRELLRGVLHVSHNEHAPIEIQRQIDISRPSSATPEFQTIKVEQLPSA